MHFTKSRITWFISFCNETMFSSFFTINELCYTYIWGLSSHSRVFHSCGDVTIDCEGLRILTYTLHSPLISECSLMCHAYSDTGFICSSPRTRDTHIFCRTFGSRVVTTCLTVQVCRDRGSNFDLQNARRTL